MYNIEKGNDNSLLELKAMCFYRVTFTEFVTHSIEFHRNCEIKRQTKE